MASRAKTSRRSVLVGAGAVGVAGLAGGRRGLAGQPGEAKAPRSGGAPLSGLTLLNFRRGGALCLGVKTAAGILDVKAAGQALKKRVPQTTDDAIRRRDLDGLRTALRAAAAGQLKGALVGVEKLQLGPPV